MSGPSSVEVMTVVDRPQRHCESRIVIAMFHVI